MMLALISLLLLSAPVLWGLNRLKVRYIFGWFWSILVCALVWGGLLLFQLRDFPDPLTARMFPLWTWRAGSDLTLLLDAVSGPFALALAGLGLAVVLTSAQRMADAPPGAAPTDPPLLQSEDWRNQAAILWLMGMGFFGVLAGNPLTLLLAWAGGDLFGLWVLLLRITGREASERIVLDFSARVAGILLVMWAMVVAQAEGVAFTFEHIPTEVHVILLLACGFRLGVLPLQVYFFEELPLRRGVGLMSRMAIPAVSSLVLLARIGETATPTVWTGLLLFLTVFAGLYGSASWFAAKSELEGRAFWVLGVGALALAAAIGGVAQAVQAWGLALLLVGGSVFLFSARSRWLRAVVGLGGVLFSALPGMPTAAGTDLYANPQNVLVWIFLLVHALLLAGFFRHVWREGEPGQVMVRAIRGAYALGLLILPGTLVLAGGLSGALKLPAAWWAAFIGVALAGGIGVWQRNRMLVEGSEGLFSSTGKRAGQNLLLEGIRQIFSFHWLYRLFWRGYRMLGSGVAFVSVLLEGEAGILWTLLLLFLLISLIANQVVTGG